MKEKYGLEIISPFQVEMAGEVHIVQFLINGHGAPHGMVVDADWAKIRPIADHLVQAGYGYSCFDLEGGGTAGFEDVLADWGKNA
ncbi:hypothetical protein IGB42_01865 [Andreprevotia sp. IGB-42]|uniref:hypothetical protein n=1 Tax=Andreprevotia sp. IGB-42 TaxID=2497473 RepID=UPI0013590473|nr:hypothetical protein [Andreprevotia sp. IGB-42]KAF0813514.1 hypothetical protein IGB42_01865 [Andreprevotia sp. IGB-42]